MQFGDNNNQFMYNGYPQSTGYQYNGYNQPQQPRRGNFLSQAQVEKLMKKSNQFSLALTEEDAMRAVCNHRKPDGSGDALTDNLDGSYTCQICGYTFRPIVDTHSITPEEIQADVDNVVDVLQTIKMIYVDLDPAVAKEYFNIIPLLEKMPEFLDLAIKNYAKHEQYNPYNYGKTNLNTAQMFAALTGFFNGGGQPYQYQQAPYGAPQQGYAQQPQYGQQYNPQGQYANPFGYAGASQQPQYQPQTGGYAYQPNAGFNPQAQYTAPAPQQAQPQQTASQPKDTTAAGNINVTGSNTKPTSSTGTFTAGK